MPKKGMKRRAEEEPQEEVPAPIEEEEEEEIEEGDDDMASGDDAVHEGDEIQEVSFDINLMEEKDCDGVFHLLQRWLPGEWCIDCDDISTALASSPITSIVKVPDDEEEEEDGLDIGDTSEDIYGVTGVVGLSQGAQKKGIADLVGKLSELAITEEKKKKDLKEFLTAAALKKEPVGLVVNERLVNLPPELGAQLHVNMFDELKSSGGGGFSHLLILSKVVIEKDEQDKAAAEPKKKKCSVDEQGMAVNEETSLFIRPEELFYFRHRHPDIAVKRYVFEGTPGGEQCSYIVPLLVPRRSWEALCRDIKTLDAYFAAEN